MKKTWKRLISLLLVCIMVLSMTGLTAFAGGKEDSDPVGGTAVLNASSYGIVTNPTGKKGIIASYWTDRGTPYYESDPTGNLGIDHVLMNIDLNDVISTSSVFSYNYGGSTFTKPAEAFPYQNQTYYFKNYNDSTSITTFTATLQRLLELRAKGIAITVQVVMSWPSDSSLQSYIFPSGREAGHDYYALNTSTTADQQKISAALHYLVYKCPYVNNWMVGSEINSPYMANFCGTNDLNTNVTIACQSFDLLYQAIQDQNPQAKAYVCLDNIWTLDRSNASPQGLKAKDFLDGFASRESGKNWNLAYHPYPVPYEQSEDASQWLLWSKNAISGRDGTAHYTTFSEDTEFITGANLSVLTNYVKNHFGSTHRIILSEFGYDVRGGQQAQAAELYYTYKSAEANDMIDACIYQPWTDTGWDFRQMGLEDSSGNHRASYEVFKHMDVDNSLEASYLSYLGISSWTDSLIGSSSPSAPSGPSSNSLISGVYIPDQSGTEGVRTMRAGAVFGSTPESGTTFTCTVIDYSSASYGTSMFPAVKTTSNASDNWMFYTPLHPGNYGFLWRAIKDGNIISEKGASRYFTGNTVSNPGIYVPDRNASTLNFAMSFSSPDMDNVNLTWYIYRPDTGKWVSVPLQGLYKNIGCSYNWKKLSEGRYWIMCRATAANNPNSTTMWGVEINNGKVIG